jgi:hypothetical protein
MDILTHLSRDKDFKKYKIHLMGDFNLDLLKFNIHGPTEEFIDAMFTKPIRLQH